MRFTDNAMTVHLLRRDNGGYQTPATHADIVQCLRANPEAAGQVLLALESQYIAGETAKHIARASQAERELATVTAERDEARALEKRSEQLRALDRAEVVMFRKERDALRAQLAKAEKVVGAARQHLRCDLTDTESISAEHALQNALRALDSPVVAGTDSGGASGAAVGNAAPPVPNMPAQAGEQPGGGDTTLGDTHPPEPAGSSQPDPLAALAAVLSLPLTEEDRKRIEGVVSRLRPEQPRGGLLPEPWERRPSLDPQAPATRAERCTTFCVEDSATCRRRAGHSGQHAASLNVARQLDETVTRAELDELRRRVEWLENLTGSGSGSGSG